MALLQELQDLSQSGSRKYNKEDNTIGRKKRDKKTNNGRQKNFTENNDSANRIGPYY